MPSAMATTGHPLSPSAIPSNPPDLSDKLPRLTPRTKSTPSANPLPVPETPSLPPLPAEVTYQVPRRRILSPRDLETFQKSPTYDLILSFVFRLSESIQDTPTSAIEEKELEENATLQKIQTILAQVDSIVDACPPLDQGGSRFGNPAFRSFLDAVERANSELQLEVLGTDHAVAATELGTYFLHSFGSRTRIDYGSGHELNFIIYLLCLNRLGLLPESTFPILVLRIFSRYISLMRRIQQTYYLEPAGSHGVWGLDDYQFMPFLFGASQLLHHPHIRPKSIHQKLTLEEFSKDYMYLNQVSFINSVKNVEGLRWHSPMLDDISAARSWEKVENGMRRMFVREVLGRLPVMQHFLFGGLVPAVEGMSDSDEVDAAEDPDEGGVIMQEGMKHVHQHSSWGDCCGIRVPGSIGAAQELKKRTGGEEFRRLPFD